MTKELKTNRISAEHVKEAMSSAFGTVSGSLFQRLGAALRNGLGPGHLMFVFPLNPQMLSQHREVKQREWDRSYGERRSCGCCDTTQRFRLTHLSKRPFSSIPLFLLW